MPRLVLLEDDGREVFSGNVSRPMFIAIFAFLERHGGFIRAAAATSRAVRELLEGVAAAPERLPPAPRSSRRRGGRA